MILTTKMIILMISCRNYNVIAITKHTTRVRRKSRFIMISRKKRKSCHLTARKRRKTTRADADAAETVRARVANTTANCADAAS